MAKMDFWEEVAKLIADKWYDDTDPFDLAPQAKNSSDLVEWAARIVEEKIILGSYATIETQERER